MIRSVTYTGLQPGRKFLVIGAIHGNEKCGTVAIQRIMAEIDGGMLEITRGQVTFVPIANPRAYELDQRYAERNLNRYLVPMEKPDSYEAWLGNILCPLLEACDVQLALHSYTVGGAPFTLVAPSDTREHAFAAGIGPYTMLTGWAQAYAANRSVKSNEAIGSDEYARQHGAIAVTIECGQHKDPAAPEIAYQAIRNALRYLEMTAEPKLESPHATPDLIVLTHVYYRSEGGQFAKDWKNLEAVGKDQIMAVDGDKLPIAAPDMGYIIMPKADCPPGEEWFYFGVKRQMPDGKDQASEKSV